MMYATPLYTAEPGTVAPYMQRLLLWASWLLSVPVLVFSAGPFFLDAWRSLRQGQIGLDVPVALGIAVTFVVSSGAMFKPGGSFGHEVYFDSMTMFVSFLMVGRYLELKARHRVAAALEGAVSRLPESARRIDAHGAVVVIALAGWRSGDAVRVLRGEAFPRRRPPLRRPHRGRRSLADRRVAPGGEGARRRGTGRQPEPAVASAAACRAARCADAL